MHCRVRNMPALRSQTPGVLFEERMTKEMKQGSEEAREPGISSQTMVIPANEGIGTDRFAVIFQQTWYRAPSLDSRASLLRGGTISDDLLFECRHTKRLQKCAAFQPLI
jgi:hypothetical protein